MAARNSSGQIETEQKASDWELSQAPRCLASAHSSVDVLVGWSRSVDAVLVAHRLIIPLSSAHVIALPTMAALSCHTPRKQPLTSSPLANEQAKPIKKIEDLHPRKDQLSMSTRGRAARCWDPHCFYSAACKVKPHSRALQRVT